MHIRGEDPAGCDGLADGLVISVIPTKKEFEMG